MTHKRFFAVVVVAAGLSGCAMSVPYDPVPPRKWLMMPPEKLAEVKEGDDIYEDNARVRAAYGREADKVRSLQTYIRTLRKNSKVAK